MNVKKKKSTKQSSGKMPRTTVSLPAETQEHLERVAAEKKVSVAWVIRDAVDKYLASGTPDPQED